MLRSVRRRCAMGRVRRCSTACGVAECTECLEGSRGALEGFIPSSRTLFWPPPAPPRLTLLGGIVWKPANVRRGGGRGGPASSPTESRHRVAYPTTRVKGRMSFLAFLVLLDACTSAHEVAQACDCTTAASVHIPGAEPQLDPTTIRTYGVRRCVRGVRRCVDRAGR